MTFTYLLGFLWVLLFAQSYTGIGTIVIPSNIEAQTPIPNTAASGELELSSVQDTGKRQGQTLPDGRPEIITVQAESIDNTSASSGYGLQYFWTDPFHFCNTKFKCSSQFRTIFANNATWQFSTNLTNFGTWSGIISNELPVAIGGQYELVIQMKLNPWATASHVALEGFNASVPIGNVVNSTTTTTTNGTGTTSILNPWYQIRQCPGATDGPLQWHTYSCEVTIPKDTTKVRIVLNAGWSSSKEGDVAITNFDGITFGVVPKPILRHMDLRAQAIFQGLDLPTKMAFLGPSDFLILEKNRGTIQRIVNGVKAGDPVLDVNVAVNDGMLGIGISPKLTGKGLNKSGPVFLYYTETSRADSEDLLEGKTPLGNRLYRYDFVNNELKNPTLLFSVPATPPKEPHSGGTVLVGPDGNVYFSVGDLGSVSYTGYNVTKSQAINFKSGSVPDGRAGILKVTPAGKVAGGDGILGGKSPLNKYYAYGIRNSFGMDFDPVTKKLWISDNGPDVGDEINLVEPGFNGGWAVYAGNMRMTDNLFVNSSLMPKRLVDFGGRGFYDEPKLIWGKSVGVTALEFSKSDKLGEAYTDGMFVGDAGGRIYYFNLSNSRTELDLEGDLSDKIAQTLDEIDDNIIGEGFGVITDLKSGPDGNLYVVSMDQGRVYRITANA